MIFKKLFKKIYYYKNKPVYYIKKCKKKDLYIVESIKTNKRYKIQKHLLEQEQHGDYSS